MKTSYDHMVPLFGSMCSVVIHHFDFSFDGRVNVTLRGVQYCAFQECLAAVIVSEVGRIDSHTLSESVSIKYFTDDLLGLAPVAPD